MLLPISHEKMTVRRMPVVTLGLVVLTVVAFVLASAVGPELTEGLGYVPDRANLLGLVTYMFAHADVWHVAGNMWFLFLCGLSLEDRWGRLPFAIYYLMAGVVAAGVHHLATSNGAASLIGASGAVAGAMGAFYGLAIRSSGTAHWAHVGGFAFGVAVAGAFRIFGVDRRLDDAVERAAVLGNDPRVDAARALVAKGEADQAVVLLEGLAKEKPGSTHVQEALRQAQRASTSTATAAVVVDEAPSVAASPAVEPAPFFPPPGG